ncbi:MAG: sigma-70 family RNA polymerase sigma factor [Dehalococcoidales bacterium]|nr:sigma-70 family RNA polymerase sigma factor [Dehalococcoidales bacterium]
MVASLASKEDEVPWCPTAATKTNVDVGDPAEVSLLSTYVKQAVQVPLLTAEDEVRLAQAYEEGREASEQLKGELPTEQLASLEAIARAGEEARQQIIEANLRLVVKMAIQRHRRGYSALSLLDLVQEGNIGLMRAVEKFDWQLGYRFSTYAIWWIRRAIDRAIADHGRPIRIPLHLQSVVGKMAQAEAQLMATTGRQPRQSELAEAAGVSERQAAEIRRYTQPVISLDQPANEEGSIMIADLLADSKATTEMDKVPQGTLGDELDRLLNTLPTREKKLITKRFGLDGSGGCTLEEAGQALGITRERARQLEARALGKLRNLGRAASLNDYFSN